MSHPIKYRQILNGMVHYWGYIDGGFVAPMNSVEWADVPSDQFTGHKDKNDVEIYEGDVVRKTWSFKTIKPDDSYSNARVCIEWMTCGIRWLPPHMPEDEGFWPLYNRDEDPESLGEPQWDLSTFEVIGNIYENTKLLEKTS